MGSATATARFGSRQIIPRSRDENFFCRRRDESEQYAHAPLPDWRTRAARSRPARRRTTLLLLPCAGRRRAVQGTRQRQGMSHSRRGKREAQGQARPAAVAEPAGPSRRVALAFRTGGEAFASAAGMCVFPHLFFFLSFFLLVTSRELRAGSACAMRMRRYSSVRRLQVFCATTTFCCALSFSTWSAAL
jgi:hypothetical protein